MSFVTYRFTASGVAQIEIDGVAEESVGKMLMLTTVLEMAVTNFPLLGKLRFVEDCEFRLLIPRHIPRLLPFAPQSVFC